MTVLFQPPGWTRTDVAGGAELALEKSPRPTLSLGPCHPAGLLLVNSAEGTQSLTGKGPSPENCLPREKSFQ